MPELPADMREIRAAEYERPHRRQWPFARHQIQYTYGPPAAATVLADFVTEGPLPIPAEGQVIELHGVRVKVTGVLVSYYAAADGAPVVLAAVRVDSAALFPSARHRGAPPVTRLRRFATTWTDGLLNGLCRVQELLTGYVSPRRNPVRIPAPSDPGSGR